MAWWLVQGVLVQKVIMDPYPLSPEFFMQRMKGIDAGTSAAIFAELTAAGIILEDNHSHFMLYETWYSLFPVHEHILTRAAPQLSRS